MARVTKDFAFGYDAGQEVENSSGITRYGSLVVISTEAAYQDFLDNYSEILLWAAPSDDPEGEEYGYFIAYTSEEPRSTPVEGVESNVGFLRASSEYGPSGETAFVEFVNSRFSYGSESGSAAQSSLTANGMWSNFGLTYD